MGTRRLTPSELGIEDVNLKATTDNNSVVLDVRNAFAWTALVVITETGSPGNGAADLIVDVMEARESTTETFSHTIDTGIDIQTNALTELVTWGHGLSAATTSSGTAGTISTTPAVIANADFIRLNLKASTANDGTTCTASVTLWIEEV